MPISGIEGLGAFMGGPAAAFGVRNVAPTSNLGDLLEPGKAADGGASSFGVSLASAVDNLTAAQAKSSDLAVKAVTGDLDDVHDYTIAATEAAVTLELTAALRNKAVDAFTEIMRMQA
ncbi:flagellar hook-basal body complex protein FliE [Georgenia yuyongxinii]|uniref:Flagellar hook-basal body complex protein FliE n=1 Tax=Georgenia yuyongxinii TaxID=2589797 RepID=A0A5B8C0K6_9MICO|nr:flagellar hook-basal body complex protein FliE [Georgenia yuyongxinii]QDC23637.1 flagellar hook-basal body complex protein FliE [Georgenia yuyongxinii]